MKLTVLNVSRFYFSILKQGDAIGVKGNLSDLSSGRSSGGSSSVSSGGSSGGLFEYYHLGIYLGGPNKEVIDYVDSSEVRKIRLTIFTENDTRPLCRIQYTNAPPIDKPTVIAERAVAKFTNQDYGQYDRFAKNCEHFATYCMFGEGFSVQAMKAKDVCVIM